MNGTDFTSRNFKRIAEVWLDDYKEVFYQADPRKRDIDPGDLTKAKMIREKLQCKPFDYFLEEIAPEMYTRYFYQKDYPGYFANGLIRSELMTNLCLDTMGHYQRKIGVYPCHKLDNKKEDLSNQYFILTWHKKLKNRGAEGCLQNNLVTDWCRYEDNVSYQQWKYDVETKQVINIYVKDIKCLKLNTDKTIDMVNCDAKDISQKWTFTYVNEVALRRFDLIRYEQNHFSGMEFIQS